MGRRFFLRGGVGYEGVVFSLPMTLGVPPVMATFPDSAVPNPQGDVLLSNNTLYGVTDFNGADNFGTVFELPPIVPEPTTIAISSLTLLRLD